MIALIRMSSREVLVRGTQLSFWIWLSVGVMQLLVPGTFRMWRQKLVATEGRGVLSLATEPSYFALALLLLAVAIIIASGKGYRLLVLAVLVSLFIAKSAVGAVYGVALLIVFAPGSVARKTAATLVGLGLVSAAVLLQPESRFATVITMLISDPWTLARRDMSFGLRWINVELPIRGFIQAWGAPHGLYQWGFFQRAEFLRTYTGFSWEVPYTQFTSGRILSIHGRLLFELGAGAILVYWFLWRIIREHGMAMRIAAILVVMGFNGLTLNSPFLSLVLAAAYSFGNSGGLKAPKATKGRGPSGLARYNVTNPPAGASGCSDFRDQTNA
jgi:hypothetical protein